MPKETFHNLSEEKKRKIFVAAVKEFSTRRFSEASINQIIKAAEIPRGSFYQYFNGKEDLFSYLYDEISKEKREVVRQAGGVDREADVFALCLQSVKATFDWGRRKPEYTQIALLMEIDDSEFIVKLRMASTESLREVIERDKERGLIAPQTDSALVADMIYTLIWKQFSLNGHDEQLFLQKVGEGIGIIKKGSAIV